MQAGLTRREREMTMRRRCTLDTLVALALLLAAGPASAQQLQPGQRIRVTAPELKLERAVGELRWVDRDSLVLDTPAAHLALPTGLVQQVEVSRGRKGHTLLGTAIGAGVGLAAGFLLFAPGSSECTGSGDYEEYCMWYRAGAMVGGAVVGALTGTLIRSERWEPIPLPGTR